MNPIQNLASALNLRLDSVGSVESEFAALFGNYAASVMFGRKDIDESVANRLEAIKNAQPVRFSQLQNEVRRSAPKADREEERRPVYKFGIALTSGGDERRCVVRDISETGAKIVLEGAIALPREFRLVIDGYRAPTTAALVWQKDNEAGITFE